MSLSAKKKTALAMMVLSLIGLIIASLLYQQWSTVFIANRGDIFTKTLPGPYREAGCAGIAFAASSLISAIFAVRYSVLIRKQKQSVTH